VAVADKLNHRMQIFDREGNCKRQFGSKREEADGQFYMPSALAADVHSNLLVLGFSNRLQVLSPGCTRLCTRNGLGLKKRSSALGGASTASGKTLSELDVPEWQELAGDRLGWRKMLKSIKIRT
jgi:hypothetical protein